MELMWNESWERSDFDFFLEEGAAVAVPARRLVLDVNALPDGGRLSPSCGDSTFASLANLAVRCM